MNPVTLLRKSIHKTRASLSAQPYLGPDIHDRVVKPLDPVASYGGEPEAITYVSLKAWHASQKCADTHKFFDGYPTNSLIGGLGRELLYHMVRSMKPQVVIEVGTYYAGTSEAMVRGLFENGRGMLHTTDPFGVERCPAIISGWPEQLRKHTRFYPQNSMEFFASLERQKAVIDIAFIDGNHDYEYAYFDLASAAKMMHPGGIVVLDNIEQPGPYWAGVAFLKQNPEWTEIGQSIADFSPANPFDQTRSFIGDTAFLILKAPEDYVIKSAPLATGQQRYAEKQLSGIRLDMVQPAPKGTLHAQVFLRGFSNGRDPEQLITFAKVSLNGESTCQMKLPQTLRTRFSSMNVEHYHTVEIVLYWQPEGSQELLRLKSAPTPFA